MLEYVLFDDASVRRLTDLLAQYGVPWTERPDTMAGCVIAFADDVPEEVLDAVEACYDELMAGEAAAAEQDGALVEKRVVGIQVTLADGSLRSVRLDGATGNLLLQHFSPEQAQALVQAIARSVLNPVDGPLCREP